MPVSMPLIAPNGTDNGSSHFRGTLMFTFSNLGQCKNKENCAQHCGRPFDIDDRQIR